jgi:hypothetical protein
MDLLISESTQELISKTNQIVSVLDEALKGMLGQAGNETDE